MKILLTGSSGRIGRAIFCRLADRHQVVGLDSAPASTTQLVGEIDDETLLSHAFEGVEAVIHTAALHAPHVGLRPDAEFERVNVAATRLVARLAREHGVPRFVFTSTTAVYGARVQDGACAWVDEDTSPEPRTIYHRTKLAAERVLLEQAGRSGLAVRVLRMSRCFPEPAPLMAVYRLHRGVDARDVADAHARALCNSGPDYRCFVISSRTPFRPEDRVLLARDAPAVLQSRAPELVSLFAQRGWALPRQIDRVYDAGRAAAELGWTPRYGFEEVLRELDSGSPEVLPAPRRTAAR